MLFLSCTALAQAHPGHPGHEDDPYRMEGLTLPLPELCFFLPLLALGACLALLQGRQRAALGGITALLMGFTAFIHRAEPGTLAGLLGSAACALAVGAILARAVKATRQAVRAAGRR
ncbi:MAG: hypothetical protein JWM59_5027 [Verrucomicrobiales bacterium]|nr:hypothetical protein [Verrucomicrobiales bacterium]